MKIEYDDKFDLLYIRFDETTQDIVNQRVSNNIVLDIGKNDKIVGIEILDAKEVIDLGNILPVNYFNFRKENLISA